MSARQVRSAEPQMVQLYGALAAERAVFNSAFNRDSFLDGIDDLLARMPDGVPADVRARLARRAGVCPVPIGPVPARARRDTRLIVWNHRWEYDKDPQLFAHALDTLAAGGTEFRLALLGPRPAPAPAALAQIRARHRERIVADGRLE